MDDIKKLLQYDEINLHYILEWCKKLNLKTFNIFDNE